jgi:hypothetical protein
MRIARWAAFTLALTLLLAWATPPATAASRGYLLDREISEIKMTDVSFAEAIDFLRDTTTANIVVDWRTLEGVGVSRDALINMHLRNITLRKALNIILTEAGAGNALGFYYVDNVLTISTQDKVDSQLYTIVYPVNDLLVQIPNINLNSLSQSISSISTSGSGSGANISTSGGAGIGSQIASGVGNSGSNLGSAVSGQGSGTSDQTLTNAQQGEALVKLIEDTVRPEIWRENGGPASIHFFNGLLIVHAPISVLEAIGGPVD